MSNKVKKNEIKTPVTGKKRKLAEMLANPDISKTKKEIAEELGISLTTMWRWTREADFIDLISELVNSYTDSELPYAYKCLLARMPVDTAAIRLFFELKQKYASPNNEVVIRIEGGDDLAD